VVFVDTGTNTKYRWGVEAEVFALLLGSGLGKATGF
jgi:hypothetical protein